MYVLNISKEYNCTNNDIEDVKIIFKSLLLSIATSIFLLCLISLYLGKISKPLLTINW